MDDSGIQIRNIDYTSDLGSLLHVFQSSFTDYPVPIAMSLPRLKAMVYEDSLDCRTSFIAWQGLTPLAFVLGAVRGRKAWVAGLGVHPDYRGRGFGTLLMRTCTAAAHEVGAKMIGLEVLFENPRAVSLYRSLGMKETDEYACLSVGLPLEHGSMGGVVEEIPVSEADAWFGKWCAGVRIPWQREDIGRNQARLTALAVNAREAAEPEGVIAFTNSPQMNIWRLAVRSDCRHQGRGQSLLFAASIAASARRASVLNLPLSTGALPFFTGLGFAEYARQYYFEKEI
jgi:ribosomal protein S18 acetylase RimI-like enzyme